MALRNEELVAISQHLLYELQMLIGTARILEAMDSLEKSDFETRVTYNALLESFCMHARVLLSFLYDDNPKKDDVVAGHFFDPGYWFLKRPQMALVLEKLRTKISKRVAHLTYYRTMTGSEEAWEYAKIADEVVLLFGRFRDLAPVGTLSSAFCEFLEEIIPSHSLFPRADSHSEEAAGPYQGGVSVLPDPGRTSAPD
jgi:hypothetical protein